MCPTCILIPAFTALAGWLAIDLTARLVFRPRTPVSVGPFVLQGAIPKQRKEIADAIAKVAAEKIGSGSDLLQVIETLDLRTEVSGMLNSRIDVVISKFIQKMPMAALVMNDSLKASVKELVLAEIINELPTMQKEVARKLSAHLNIEEIIRSKISAQTVESFEPDLEKVLLTALRPAKWLGALIGFGIGLIQLVVLWLVG